MDALNALHLPGAIARWLSNLEHSSEPAPSHSFPESSFPREKISGGAVASPIPRKKTGAEWISLRQSCCMVHDGLVSIGNGWHPSPHTISWHELLCGQDGLLSMSIDLQFVRRVKPNLPLPAFS
jgi:hypothetical protein